MKLLIVTQKVNKNDPILGFFHRWLIEFSKHCEKLTIICLEEGTHDFISGNAKPCSENFNEFSTTGVKVLSLGKEVESGVVIPAQAGIQALPSKLRYLQNFFKYIKQEESNYDHVFVHMNPIYVILGAIPWRSWNKKISLWYVHKNVDLKLRIAELIVDNIFTVAKESFNLKTEKLNIVGHGIPLNDFKPLDKKEPKDIEKKLKIISVGRITPIKNLDTLIEAGAILKEKNFPFEINIVGGPTKDGDQEYFDKLKSIVKEKKLEKEIIFSGSVPNHRIKEQYWQSDLSINLCPTGGVDKAVLESMASGLSVIVSNRAFADYFGEYSDRLIFKERNADDLASKIISLIKSEDIGDIKKKLLEEVEKKASLNGLINKIISKLSLEK